MLGCCGCSKGIIKNHAASKRRDFFIRVDFCTVRGIGLESFP